MHDVCYSGVHVTSLCQQSNRNSLVPSLHHYDNFCILTKTKLFRQLVSVLTLNLYHHCFASILSSIDHECHCPALSTHSPFLDTPSSSSAASTIFVTHISSQKSTPSLPSNLIPHKTLLEQHRQHVLQQHRHRQQARRPLHCNQHPRPGLEGEGRGPRQLRQQMQVLHDDHGDAQRLVGKPMHGSGRQGKTEPPSLNGNLNKDRKN